MKSQPLRLYVFSITLLLFFVLWAVIAARPWATRSGTSPALNALTVRERHLRHETRVVETAVRRRWAAYRRRLRVREAQIKALERRHTAQLAAANAAAASAASYRVPTSRVVTLPPQVRVVVALPPTGASTSSGSSHP